jgi:hypothetical protein
MKETGILFTPDNIRAKKHPWSSNPYVWALTFKVLR